MGSVSETAKQQELLDRVAQKVPVLKAKFQFGLARKLLAEAAAAFPDNLWLRQQLALCTYKDEDLFPAKRFADALAVLEQIGLRDPATTDAETLALGGAIYKRWWEYGGQLEDLYLALNFYRAAWERNPEQDGGYGGINAAFILQLLASRAQAAANRCQTASPEADRLNAAADGLRRAIIDHLSLRLAQDPALNQANWLLVTLAEAFFGLGAYDQAGQWLAKSKALEAAEWERQTTVRQLVAIARLQGLEPPPEKSDPAQWPAPWQALHQLLGADAAAAFSCYRGKVGLALSGGGFRASLYHLGVLARLAEMDVLRSVEVLSTVSGGSIVGAQYYLEVKRLLETKTDGEITREDYIALVRRLQRDFLDAIQSNIRMQAVGDFKKNVAMIFSKSYSRSHRLGELYEARIYAKVADGHPAGSPRYMDELLIRPPGEPDFHPAFSNWRRRAKVPILLLNATALNSGHNWRFTATLLGEPPGLLGAEVDKNARYRRLWYRQAPSEAVRRYRLGHAVAASACVPGLFEPVALEDLYPDKVVRLVDGGVHDNQGVQGLLDEGCSVVLCSDACGQMDDLDKPSDSAPAVLLRSNSILMDRVREAQYQDLKARLDSRALQGLFFIHLKKDLPVCPQDWVACQDPTPETPAAADLPYGVAPALQTKIAAIRTDLDTFSEVEAYALMCSGYLMAAQECRALQVRHEDNAEPGTWGDFEVHAGREVWPFLELEALMGPRPEQAAGRRDLELQLSVAASKAFKIWKLHPRLKIKSWLLLAAAGVLLLALVALNWARPLVPPAVTFGSTFVVLLLAAGALLVPAMRWFSTGKALRGIGRNVLIALVGSFAAWIHLKHFDRMFLERGKLSRLLDPKERTP
jgi:predicted acylesterase/phospholipase RssA